MPVISGELIIPFIIGEDIKANEPFAKRMVNRLEPWITEDLERYCQAVGTPYQRILNLAEEQGSQGEANWAPAWSKLLNPLTCPGEYLPYLAMFNGTVLPKEVNEEEARALIIKESALERGTTQSIEAAIVRTTTLEETGHTLVERGILFEREAPSGEEDAYHFLLVLEPAQVPNQERLEEAVNKVKPGGVFYTIILVEGLVWAAAPGSWSEAVNTWAKATETP